jgi:MscS family membrane protein
MEYILNSPYADILFTIIILFIFLFIRTVFTKYILTIIGKIVLNTKTNIDDKILQVLSEPLRFFILLLGLGIVFKVLNIQNEILLMLLKSLYLFNLFWVFYDLVVVFKNDIKKFSLRFGKDLNEEISIFIIKAIKFLVFFMGFASILQVWHVNIGAFIASLGLGGLALALAAKDTASNLFGGLTLLADKSLKLNDWIKVNNVEGVVEEIGLRTTKIRTFEKSLITVPNQILANTPVENFSRRGIRRIKFRVGLTYNTSSKTIQKIVSDITTMLKNHNDISQDSTMIVRFDKFEDSSLSIFVYTFTSTSNWNKYLEIKEDVNIKVIKIIEDNNSDFAFPSQTLYIKKDDNV